MPIYRATMRYNARVSRHVEFEAENDLEAEAAAIACTEWEPIDTDANDFEAADVEDQVLMLDEVQDGAHVRVVADEICTRQQMPYGRRAREFVEGLAAQRFPIESGPAAARLTDSIKMARELCGMTDEERSKVNWSVVPEQASHGERLCIMLGETVVATTPGNAGIDKRMADYIVSALIQYGATEIPALGESDGITSQGE